MNRFLCAALISLMMIFSPTPGDAAAQTPLQGRLLKKIEEQLSRMDKNLLTLQKSLADVRAEKLKVCAPLGEHDKTPLRTYLENLTHFLNEKMGDIYVGVLALWKGALNIFHWRPSSEDQRSVGSVFLKFLATLGVGIFSGFFINRWIKELSKILLKWSRRFWEKRESLQNLAEFCIGVFVSLCTPLAGFFLQIGTFFLIEKEGLFRNGMLSFATGIVIWGGIWQIQRFLFRHKIFLLRYLSGETQKSLGSRIQTFLFCFIVGGWTDELTTFYGLPESARKILMIFFGMGMVVSFFGLTQILKRPILKTLQAHNFHSFTLLTFLWTGIWNSFALLFYVLFILDETLLDFVFWPMIATLLFLPLVPFFYRGLRRIYITYLWRKRHIQPKTPLYRFLRAYVRIEKAMKIFVYGIVTFSLIKIWDIHLLLWLESLLGPQAYEQLIDMIALLLTAIIIVSVGDRLLRHYLEKNSRTEDGSIEALYLQGRLRTLLTLARTFLRVGVWIPFILLFLSILGYNVTLIMTSLGIFSVTLTFGVQSLVKDFVTGFFILLDNSLIVGDQVEIDGRTGVVEDLSLRTLKIRADNGMLQTIPFGSITVIGNKSRYFSYVIINFSAGYDADPDQIQQLLEKAYQTLKRTSGMNKKILAPIEVRGITEISDYAMVFQARLKTAPGEQDGVRRAYNKILKQLCDEAGIRVPSPSYQKGPEKRPSLTSTVLS